MPHKRPLKNWPHKSFLKYRLCMTTRGWDLPLQWSHSHPGGRRGVVMMKACAQRCHWDGVLGCWCLLEPIFLHVVEWEWKWTGQAEIHIPKKKLIIQVKEGHQQQHYWDFSSLSLIKAWCVKLAKSIINLLFNPLFTCVLQWHKQVLVQTNDLNTQAKI